MIFSYNWIKEYFDEELPTAEKMVELLTVHSFEIEGLEEKTLSDGTMDSLIDIDVLPNRAHDALCHYGMANEISIITGLRLKEIRSEIFESEEKITNQKPAEIKVDIKEDFCRRYIAKEIRGVKVEESSIEIKNKLETIGQRSINNIVDITNIVMFELNQPMHAFDTDKLDGGICVRFAKEEEQITTLDNKEVDLDSETPVISDDNGVLAIAGVKGGKKAEVDSETVNIVLESANFNQSLVRKTSNKTGIKTDSSKRFENEITPELAKVAINRATELILKYASSDNTNVFESVDVYSDPAEQTEINLTVQKTNSLLGVDLDTQQISDILNKLKFKHVINEEVLKVEIPYERLDLNIETDLVEEIGRIYGYSNILDQEIPSMDFSPKVNNEYGVNTLIRKTLVELGFSEVITSSFVAEGILSPMKPFADDRKYLRNSLKSGLEKTLNLNQKNADWLGLDHIKIFEIGKIFVGEPENYSEKMYLGISVINKQGIKKPKPGTFIKEALERLSEILEQEIKIKINEDQDIFIEILLDEVYESINSEKLSIKEGTVEYPMFPKIKNSSYTNVSQYPFVLRDIAVWLPNETSVDELVSILKNKAGELLVKEPRQFDEYKKDDKTSYAYRLVFQSFEKTLTDEEINKIMESINSEIESKGWEIR